MDEIVVHVCRTIACRARLRILGFLARKTEIAPTALADELNMSMGVLCGHLRRLSAAGIIQRRRSGVWCYCVAQSPYAEAALSGRVARWLFGILMHPSGALQQCSAAQLKATPGAAPEDKLHAIVFQAATAFTNVRRVQILRHLDQRGATTMDELSAQLKMSVPAACRHLRKLERRGYLTTVPDRWPQQYRLSGTLLTPMHAGFVAIVRSTWGRTKLQS